jgi:hypothetical protein
MSGRVVALRPQERVCQDSGPIALIYRNMGTVAAERAVSRALGDVAALVAGTAEQVRQRNLSDLERRLSRLRRLADEMGMVSLAAVAAHCAYCLAAGDATAFAAVWARLLRVAECTLEPDKGRADLMR